MRQTRQRDQGSEEGSAEEGQSTVKCSAKKHACEMPEFETNMEPSHLSPEWVYSEDYDEDGAAVCAYCPCVIHCVCVSDILVVSSAVSSKTCRFACF